MTTSCYLCLLVQQDARDYHTQRLSEISSFLYGQVHQNELALQLHLYFKAHIYDAARQQPPMLSRALALEHIEGRHPPSQPDDRVSSPRTQPQPPHGQEKKGPVAWKAALRRYNELHASLRAEYTRPIQTSTGEHADPAHGARISQLQLDLTAERNRLYVALDEMT